MTKAETLILAPTNMPGVFLSPDGRKLSVPAGWDQGAQALEAAAVPPPPPPPPVRPVTVSFAGSLATEP